MMIIDGLVDLSFCKPVIGIYRGGGWERGWQLNLPELIHLNLKFGGMKATRDIDDVFIPLRGLNYSCLRSITRHVVIRRRHNLFWEMCRLKLWQEGMIKSSRCVFANC